MNPVTNPYAPGAGQQPPELAGRDREIRMFEQVVARAAQDRPVRGVMLVGLRGVGKTVLLNRFRTVALEQGWTTAKLEVRSDVSLRQQIAESMHVAMRRFAAESRAKGAVRQFLAVLKAFSLKVSPDGTWQLAIDVDAARGSADSGDLAADLTLLFAEADALVRRVGGGVGLFMDELQDASQQDLTSLAVACHEMSQTRGRILVVGAGLPHLPAVLSDAKSYTERLFEYVPVDRLSRSNTDRAVTAPAAREGVAYTGGALDLLAALTDGYPFFIQMFAKEAWDVAPKSPITEDDVRTSEGLARQELASGFFGSRYERATQAERSYLKAVAALGADRVSTAEVAGHLKKRPSSLSPVRDSLLRKGLIYSVERGTVAFTVPHFAEFLNSQQP
jgi:hypothetical protein